METLESFVIMLIGGYLIRFSLIYSGQAWAKTYSQTVSFFLLPIITFIITKTIYGNIALSLGMIGALSIVRFRHPVKSALELIVYFDLITIGIAASVRDNFAIMLIVSTVVILLSLTFLQKYKIKSKGKPIYNISFTEGIEFNQLEVSSTSKISLIEENENLKSILYLPDNKEYLYRMTFENKESLNFFKKNIEDLEVIKKIDVNYI
jgi:hypothetical protein